ncbi:hypothetical protein E4198_13845 [Streptomyces sp. RKND-216]|uniref:SCO2400 family protein n=1 Tax=Streptomyces sp. RKND-216 TaxID=2562581 RepID=UPI00109E09E8|nr:hypothetical protein [Streptomyces sp. RKND-216]THA25644.1 hypothetical protein E4198_13845 [Streptomyces sp. RKND-216]
MDYCPTCRRHLNGALACPGCGVPAGYLTPAPGTPYVGHPAPHTPHPGHAAPRGHAGPSQQYGPPQRGGPAPTGQPGHGHPGPGHHVQGHPRPGGPAPGGPGQSAYRAQAFHQEPPQDLNAPSRRRPERAEPVPSAAPAEERAEPEARDAETPAPGGRSARRSRGRRARKGHGKRLVVLAACLGTVLLGLAVTEVGNPSLPWSAPTASSPDPQAVGANGTETQEPDDEASPDSSSADASRSPDSDPSASASAEESDEPKDEKESKEPEEEPTEVVGSVQPEPTDPAPTTPAEPEPEPTQPQPTPPQDENPEPPDDDYDDCWFIFCT